MLEMLLGIKKKGSAADVLLAGDSNMGYYGVVRTADFISGSSLSDKLGITEGAIFHNDCDWLKFAYKGKILYLAKKPIRNAISWNALYAAGAVYGDNTNGVFIPSGYTERLQDAKVTIGGKQYIVRNMRAALTDPADSTAVGKEFTDLYTKVLQANNGVWAKFTNEEIGFPSTTYYSWAVESNSSRIRLAYSGSPSTLAGTNALSTASNLTWRPVLELIA